MLLLSLAWQSLKNRRLTTSLTVFSIALSVALLLGVELVRVGARDSFANTISQTDLIVGARGGPLQLLLYSVFHIGSATNNITFATYEKLRKHPAIDWTIPYSLGDSHRGFRVVGTNEDFYSHYRYRRDRKIEIVTGKVPTGIFEIALGADVAQTLGYKIGDAVVITHGVSEHRGILDHDDKPFRVAAILGRTATPVDRSLYVTLYGMEAMHMDWGAGAPPMPGEETPAAKVKIEDLKIHEISAFLLRTKSRIDTLRLQREINTYAGDPLTAIMPGVALTELWQTLSYAENALSIVSFFVLAVGLLGMLVSIYTSLNERRREMAILRALGAGPQKIIFLLVAESAMLSTAGAMVGAAMIYAFCALAQPVVETKFGLYLPIQTPTPLAWAYLGIVIGAGVLIGFVPAIRAYRNALADGLGVRL